MPPWHRTEYSSVEQPVLRFAQDDKLSERTTHCEILLALGKLSYCFGDFGELGVNRAVFQPEAMIDGGRAADHGSGGDVLRDATLRDGDGAVSDFYVAADADLSGEDCVVADVGSSGEADLGTEERVVSDGATVADVDHVVDFGAPADARFSNAGAIDAGIGLNLSVTFDNDVSGLDDFVPVGVGSVAFFGLGEAEAVGANDRPVLQEDVVAEMTEFSNDGVGVSEEVVADGGSAIDDDVRENRGSVSDDDVLIDHDVGGDVGVLSDSSGGMDDGGGMDSGGVLGRTVEKFDGFCPGEIRILAAEHSGGEGGEGLGDDDGRGFRRFRGGVVFGIGDERELPGGGVLDAGDSGDFGIGGGVVERGAERFRNLGKFHKKAPWVKEDCNGAPQVRRSVLDLSCQTIDG
jgi:hypothetical protein